MYVLFRKNVYLRKGRRARFKFITYNQLHVMKMLAKMINFLRASSRDATFVCSIIEILHVTVWTKA